MSRPSTALQLLRISPLLLGLTGCREPKPSVYQIPKEKPFAAVPGGSPHGAGGVPTAPAQAPMAGAPMVGGAMAAGPQMATATGASLVWDAPPRWVAKPAGSMRKGSYTLGGEGPTADLGITAFPGDVGGEWANVNRWRGQLQLAPVAAAEVEAMVTRSESNGLKFTVVDLLGSANGAPTRLLGAMVPYAGATWFFKVLGPDAVVTGEKKAFLEFLKTIRPAPQP